MGLDSRGGQDRWRTAATPAWLGCGCSTYLLVLHTMSWCVGGSAVRWVHFLCAANYICGIARRACLWANDLRHYCAARTRFVHYGFRRTRIKNSCLPFLKHNASTSGVFPLPKTSHSMPYISPLLTSILYFYTYRYPYPLFLTSIKWGRHLRAGRTTPHAFLFALHFGGAPRNKTAHLPFSRFMGFG